MELDLEKTLRLECYRAQRKSYLLKMTVEEGDFGAYVVGCTLALPNVHVPTLFLRVPHGYPGKGQPAVYFERPPLGWVGGLSVIKRAFDDRLKEAVKSGKGIRVSDILEWWSHAANEDGWFAIDSTSGVPDTMADPNRKNS